MWPKTKAAYAGDEYVVKIRDKEIRTALTDDIALGHARSARSRCRATRTTARSCAGSCARTCRAASPSPAACSRSSARTRTRRACSPARATPFRTNRRFHLLSEGHAGEAAVDRVRLGDAVRLRPDQRPDIYGKVGNSGVSIATLDDMKVLYSGFDLCDPTTSVSMTINGPAPTILAMFINTAIDQQVDKFAQDNGREPTEDEADKIRAWTLSSGARHGAGRHPEGGPGPEHLHLLDRVQPQGDGRHPGVLHPPQRAELLLGVDLRLSHRRGRREPDQPARLHARPTASRSSRPTSRAACTSTTSRRTCRSSSATAWTPSTR